MTRSTPARAIERALFKANPRIAKKRIEMSTASRRAQADSIYCLILRTTVTKTCAIQKMVKMAGLVEPIPRQFQCSP